jgi:hypothetical protein
MEKIVESSEIGTTEHPLISNSKELVTDGKESLDFNRSADIQVEKGDVAWQRRMPKLVRTQ